MSDTTSAPAPAADPTAPLRTFRAVYAGRRWTPAGLVARWYEVGEDGLADGEKALAFSCKGKKTAMTDGWVGDVRVVREFAGESYGVDLKSPREVYPDADRKAAWLLEERAAEAQAAMEKTQAKAGYGDLTLGELRGQYRRTVGGARRAALLAAVIQHVTG